MRIAPLPRPTHYADDYRATSLMISRAAEIGEVLLRSSGSEAILVAPDPNTLKPTTPFEEPAHPTFPNLSSALIVKGILWLAHPMECGSRTGNCTGRTSVALSAFVCPPTSAAVLKSNFPHRLIKRFSGHTEWKRNFSAIGEPTPLDREMAPAMCVCAEPKSRLQKTARRGPVPECAVDRA